MEPTVQRPKVGVGLFIFKENKLLLAERLDSHQFAGPGGHLEFGESFEECAIRETKEESGIEIENLELISLSNLLFWKEKHYVDIGFKADWKSGEPANLEPTVRGEWDWYDLSALPTNVLPNVRLYLAAMESGQVYSGTHR